MILDISDDKLYIKELSANLKPRHRSQLNDWGFKKKGDDEGLYLDDEVESTFPKVIRYFEKVKLDFDLSETSQELLEKLTETGGRFQELREKGRKLKDGQFDQTDFAEHLAFLESNVPRRLKGHQLKASYHLWLTENGANFSVPGAGKTTVILSVYERLRMEGKVNALFVVGPPACFGPWKHEFETVLGREVNYKILAGGDRGQRKGEYFKQENIAELYLTTFQTLLKDHKEAATFLNGKKTNAMLVIDEAHYIKQVNGNWANAVLNIARHAKYRSVLTGTPIPKSYTDLYNLFDFLWLDNSPIGSSEKAKLRIMEEKQDYQGAGEILEPTIGPLFYRVRKVELGLAKQVFNDPELIQMNTYERKIYDAIVKKIREYATEDYLKNIDLVERLRRGRMIRLRQCLSYVKLLATAIEEYDEDLIKDDSDLRYVITYYDENEVPGKLTRLFKLIERFQKLGEKVVIWAHFIGTIKLIEQHLKKTGYYCKKIIGQTPVERTAIDDEETREKIRNEFVDPNSGLDILIANPAACAESISLHKTCFNAVYYDLSYNCAQFLQSLDRIHRVGGSEEQEAYYHFLQYENTLEPEILANLESKAQRMYDIIEGDYNIYSLDMFEGNDELDVYKQLFLHCK
ncbi:MAG: DEAD/DEAH box helicase [Cytophagales bacterium]|nr:DEAD/DEAH box helicase [Cytophagales bacterium]